MTVLLGVVPSLDHSQPGHPESPQRIQAVIELLETSEIWPTIVKVDINRATFDQILQVHGEGLYQRVRQASTLGGGYLDADTYATQSSYEAAMDAAGTSAYLVSQIMTGEPTKGIALVRPPGHHAERDRVGGFCLFNNVAIAARQAQMEHGAERVAIVDIDVHHGNGTQQIFYDDPSVLFISTHQHGYFFYPGTGAMNEIGDGAGKGFTLNVPFPPGAGDYWYSEAMTTLIRPKIDDFKPDVLLVSAGFDAHWIDPLASERLSLNGYANLISSLVEIAEEHCDGKMLVVLEGGYHLTALSHGVLNMIFRMMGLDTLSDPLGPSPHPEQDMTNVLSKVRHLHLLK